MSASNENVNALTTSELSGLTAEEQQQEAEDCLLYSCRSAVPYGSNKCPISKQRTGLEGGHGEGCGAVGHSDEKRPDICWGRQRRQRQSYTKTRRRKWKIAT